MQSLSFGIRATGLGCMPVSTRMDSRIEGLSSTVSRVQNQLDNHRASLKSHNLDLQIMKEILDRAIVGQERLSSTQDRFASAQAWVADELAAMREAALGSGKRFQVGEGSSAGGVGRWEDLRALSFGLPCSAD